MFQLFLLILIIFIVWSETKNKNKQSGGDQAHSYQKGYWDGYRALGAKIEARLDGPRTNFQELKEIIDAGKYGPSVTNQAANDQVTAPTSQAPITTPVVAGTSTQAKPAAAVALTPEERSLKNLNTLLYMGSFLIVAAGAALMLASVSDTAKLVTVWSVVALFYIGGLSLHSSSVRLKPAAVAFIGTGLALIPFGGIAIAQFTNASSESAWFLTSLVGLIGYYYAAMRLQSQLVSYLTLAFVLSLASSITATMQLQMVWYFVVLIGISLFTTLLAYIRPKWVSPLFQKPVERTGQVVTPLTLAASLVLHGEMDIASYQVVFGVAALHYFVVWVQQQTYLMECAARALTHVTLLLAAWQAVDRDVVAFGIIMFVLASGHQLASLYLVNKSSLRSRYEQAWVAGMIVLQLIAISLWDASSLAAPLTTASLLMIGAASTTMAFRLRSLPWAYVGLIVSLIVPFVAARSVLVPPLPWRAVASWFVFAAGASMYGVRRLRLRSVPVINFMTAAASAYTVITFVVAEAVDNMWLAIALQLAAAAVFYALSYARRVEWFILAGNFIIFLVLGKIWQELGLAVPWQEVGVGMLAATIFYAAAMGCQSVGSVKKRQMFVLSTWAALVLAAIQGWYGSSDAIMMTAAAALVILAASVAYESKSSKHTWMFELSVYQATLGLQRMVALSEIDFNLLAYVHWWALTVAAVAAARYVGESRKARFILAMGAVTLFSASYALGEGGGYALLFLIEHLALLAIGALFNKQWAAWWGAIATSLAILYFLRDYTFLWLGLLGLALIGLVVWRLNRSASDSGGV